MGVNFLHSMSKGVKSAGKWVGNAGKSAGKGVSSGGKWIGHAAEDSFNWTTKTAGNVGNKVMDFADSQVDKITGLLSSPTLLIVVGVVVVGGIFILSRK